MINRLSSVYRSFKTKQKEREEKKLLNKFFASGQTPWSPGYEIHKEQEIKKSLEPFVIDSFSKNNIPSCGYGLRLDERIVEYPWLFSRLSSTPNINVLDAGSTFNYDYIVENSKLKEKNLFIHTYFPEDKCFWQKRISYVFGDLRDLPYRNSFFDEIICHSTLEHIGMDNSIYGYSIQTDKNKSEKSYEYLKVIQELSRVLRPGGRLLLTFPFGKFENHGFFQQFDSEMLQKVLDEFDSLTMKSVTQFLKYTTTGWTFALQKECEDAKSFNPHTGAGDLGDGAAHSRAICCVTVDKTAER